MSKIKNKKEITSSGIIFIFLILLFYLEIIKFNIFPQAYILYSQKVKIVNLILNMHPHFLRYLIIIPSIFIGELLKVNVNTINTIYSIVLLSFINYYILKIIHNYSKLRLIVIVLTFLFISFLSLNINGRIIFAYFGQIIIINAFIYERGNKLLLYIIIGIFYTTVSSGTMIVTVLATIFLSFYDGYIKIKNIKLFFLIFPLGIIFFKYFYLMLNKNYTYYEKSIYKIFQHGILSKFYNNPFFIFILCLYILFSLTYLLIILKRKTKKIGIFESMAFLCGLFGVTTFFMCIIPIFIHINIILFRGKRKNESIKDTISSNVLDSRI